MVLIANCVIFSSVIVFSRSCPYAFPAFTEATLPKRRLVLPSCRRLVGKDQGSGPLNPAGWNRHIALA
jgi:hypothetical protein